MLVVSCSAINWHRCLQIQESSVHRSGPYFKPSDESLNLQLGFFCDKWLKFVVYFGCLLKASNALWPCLCRPGGEIPSLLCFWPYCLEGVSDRCVSEALCCSCMSLSLLDCRICVAISCFLNWIRLTPFSLPSCSDVSIWFLVCTDESEIHIYPTRTAPSCPSWSGRVV